METENTTKMGKKLDKNDQKVIFILDLKEVCKNSQYWLGGWSFAVKPLKGSIRLLKVQLCVKPDFFEVCGTHPGSEMISTKN